MITCEKDIDEFIQEINQDEDYSKLILYANDKENFCQIEELKGITYQKRNEIKLLKIVQSELKNLKGINEIGKNLIEIDFTSNKIENLGVNLKNMTNLKILNLSCNILTHVNGIEYLVSIEEIILSHNKISNLDGFRLLGENQKSQYKKNNFISNLNFVDLKDNLISSLNQVINFEKFGNLSCLIFQDDPTKNSNYCINPICEYENYVDFISTNLPQVKMLDNRDIKSFLLNFQSDLYNHMILDTRKNPFNEGAGKYKTSKSNTGNQNLDGKKELVSQYKIEIQSLHSTIEELFQDQKELIIKYEKTEKFYKSKCDKLDHHISNLKTENIKLQNLEGEKDFLIRELQNKLSMRESEIFNLKKSLEETKNTNSDYFSKISLLKKDLEYSQNEYDKLNKRNQEICRENMEIRSENMKLKDDVKNDENFYKDLANKKTEEINSKIRQINSLENKIFDFSKTLTEKQKEIESLIESHNVLQNNMLKYAKQKSETEYEMTSKFEKEKEEIIKKYKQQIEETEEKMKKVISSRDEDFLKDIKIIEKSYQEIITEKENKLSQSNRDLDKINQSLNDAKELLKISLINEEKHENLIKELEINLEKLRNEKISLTNQFSLEKENLVNKLKIMELEIKDQNDEILKSDTNLRNLKKIISDKDIDNHSLYDENQKLKKELSIINYKLEQIEEEIILKQEEINNLNQKLSSDKNLVIIEELNATIKTKNLMLDDQTSQIINLKKEISHKENDIIQVNMKIEKLRQKNDNKISGMKEEYESLKELIQSRDNESVEYEEIIKGLKNDIELILAENQKLVERLNQREEIIKLIQSEIDQIKINSEQNNTSIKQKSEEITNLKELIDELNKNLVMKNRENREIIEHFEEYKKEKNMEIEVLNKKLEEVNNDMLVVLNEYEKQKNVLRMNIQNLNNMFGI